MNRDPFYRSRRVVAPLLAGVLGTTLLTAGACARPGSEGSPSAVSTNTDHDTTGQLPLCARNAPSEVPIAPEPVGTTIDLIPNSPTSLDTLLGVDGPDAQTAGLTTIEGQLNDFVQQHPLQDGGEWTVAADVSYTDPNGLEVAGNESDQLGTQLGNDMGIPHANGATLQNDVAGTADIHLYQHDNAATPAPTIPDASACPVD
jgi:hypothetical protein